MGSLNTTKTLVAASFFALGTAGAASAVTIAEGGTGCESAGNLAAGLTCDVIVDADFGQSIANGDTATFAGAGTLFGFVADDKGTSSNYADSAKITFLKDVYVSFGLISPTNGFDALLTFGGLPGVTVNGLNGIVDLGFVAAGSTLNFVLDATKPTNSVTRQESSYALTTTLAPVPVPASLPMLALGLLGAGYFARRKSA